MIFGNHLYPQNSLRIKYHCLGSFFTFTCNLLLFLDRVKGSHLLVREVDRKYGGKSSLPAVTNQYRSEQSRNSIILSFIRPLTSKKWVAGCPICIQAAVQTTIVGLNTLTNYPAGRQNIPAEIIN